MGIRAAAKGILEKLTGRRIYKKLPLGIDPLEDLISRFPGYNCNVIFDVGANIGQSAIPFSTKFPRSRIYCFEPVSRTFSLLVGNVKRYDHISCYQIALGSKKGEMSMVPAESPDRNSLKDQQSGRSGTGVSVQEETITLDTLADFCAGHGIAHINYLKVDTEGFDLEVMKGGEVLLDNAAIDFIELEAGMNPGNTLHVPFEEIKEYLEQKGYCLFGIYEQVQEWISNKPILRRSNPLFISPKLANG